MENLDIVKATIKLLSDSKDVWESRYDGYAVDILANEKEYEEKAGMFSVKKPLVVYSSIGKVKNKGIYCYDLRFGGQSVGNIVIEKDLIPKLKVEKKYADIAKNKFGFADSVPVDGDEWPNGCKSKAFQAFYYGLKSCTGANLNSKEHLIESLLLKEFSKRGEQDGKLLRNIQPVKLGGQFFQLTTPLGASDLKRNGYIPKIVGGNAGGGGIDILARVRHEGENRTRLAVIELKDENKQSEPQREVMFQALVYATFVACLLRSKKGREWWQIFRESDKVDDVPADLHLDVVTLMPKGNSEEGNLDDIVIDNFVTLHLYTLYYDLNVDGHVCGFSGTLKGALKK